ncbi:alcohol dehydrogenase [Litorimonas cladophorae]|uniref:Alcohol dehydrogenase 2 n=1 Tax=Litorimonas cladophorae TaxID=1220491 RepID=A0A918ND01_9PROT|nr:iron-containing alcohol dehydrogenase [Litorimonas cladophorae]GGX63401.1 alcohol dehydrogenase [Litorimonas cladophorae]
MHTFKTVSDIRIAPGGAAKLDLLIEGLSSNKRVAIVTDKGVRSLGLMDSGIDALESAGFDVMIFDQVVADPPEAIMQEIADGIRAFGAGLVIGFGGGSPMDTAKVAAHLAGCDQPLETMYGVDNAKGPKLPLLLIPTTSGTGSEVTNVAILTTGKTAKKGVVADSLYADRVLLDAELTLGLPASITAATGIDAMVHAIEAYTSIRLKNPMSDALALTALRKLRNNIVQAVNEPTNLDARNEMLIGAMIAGQAFSNAPCAAVHALAYPLGGFFHVPHGLSNALVLTEVMKYNQPKADHWYAEIATDLGVGQSGSALVDEMLRIKDATKVPQTLTEVNIPSDAIIMMADDAMTKDRLLMNNARVMTHEAVVKIYETIL